MSKDRVIDEFIKVSVGFFKSLEGAKDYSKEKFKNKMQHAFEKFDFVKREEFEEVKALILKAREKNKELSRKITTLEKKLVKK